jgi:hypothetical protein
MESIFTSSIRNSLTPKENAHVFTGTGGRAGNVILPVAGSYRAFRRFMSGSNRKPAAFYFPTLLSG